MQQICMNQLGRCQITAMVQPVNQELTGTFPPAQALRSGTLFPELYKPMKGQGHTSDGCHMPQELAAAFSAWDMRLYLDTHPHNPQALNRYRQLCTQTMQPNYACTFASGGGNHWEWVDDPWPWEYAANAGRK